MKEIIRPHILPWGSARFKDPSPLLKCAQALATPDCLESDLSKALWTAHQVHQWEGNRSVQEQQGLFLVLVALWETLGQGSTSLSIKTLSQWALRFASCLPNRAECIQKAFDAFNPKIYTLLGTPLKPAPWILDNNHLYVHRHWKAETRIADALRTKIGEADLQIPIQAILKDLHQRPPGQMIMTSEQEEAVKKSLTQTLTLISGGPGTGKTTIVVNILRAAIQWGIEIEDIALAAPTGKAAHRLNESIMHQLSMIPNPTEKERLLIQKMPEAKTLHRLLEFNGHTSRFGKNGNNPLHHKLIVIDESSMISLSLMDRLLEACARPQAHLIFLGDADQLPSVDAGTAFKDMIDGFQMHHNDHIQYLMHSFRMKADDPQGQEILKTARAINQGIWPDHIPHLQRTSEIPKVQGVATLNLIRTGEHWQDRRWKKWLKTWFKHWILTPELQKLFKAKALDLPDELKPEHPLYPLISKAFESLSQSQILALVKHSQNGVDEINDMIHGWIKEIQSEEGPFAIGEWVMMTHNDYRRKIFNGDIGLTLKLKRGRGLEKIMVAFKKEDGFYLYPMDHLKGHIQWAYAMTIHKSQGSEYQRIALVLPPFKDHLLSREILYTGLTRSKKSVLIVGPIHLLPYGASQKMQRYSQLSSRLRT